MRPGMYVRCPVIRDDEDAQFPRYFVMGQITHMDAIADTVKVRFHDLFKAKIYYEFAFNKRVFESRQVFQCSAPVGCSVIINNEWAKVVHVEISETKGSYTYILENHQGEIVKVEETELKIDFTQMNFSPKHQMENYEFHNPSWYINRLKVSNTAHILNNAVYGFRTLTGCRANLLPHQIVTIVRCLETRPVRYMLADEVGLGKTIEACAIIKILQEQNSSLQTLYIIPDSLVDQWKGELDFKFQIQAEIYDGHTTNAQHLIVPLPLLEQYYLNNNKKRHVDILVMDETHRLLDNPLSYRFIEELSKSTEHILLLSATPIQDRKEEFQRLLTLLNPQYYGRMPLAAFSEMVEKQSQIQKRIYNVLSQMEDYRDFASSVKKRLISMSEDLSDITLRRLVEDINLQVEDQGLDKAQQSISYICENYRLERRVIRNRRDMLRNRMPQRLLRTITYRMASSDELYNEAGAIEDTMLWLKRKQSTEPSIMHDDIKPIVSAAFSSPWALLAQLRKRNVNDKWLLDSVEEWCRSAEAEIDQIDMMLDKYPEMIRGRLARAVDFIDQETDVSDPRKECKLLIFSCFKETLEQMAIMLRKRLGNEAVALFHQGMDRLQLQESADIFQSNEQCKIMLCDETGGEGRNFQFAKMILHLDLPWTANELEQRIGRLDRLGRPQDEPVMSVVFHTMDTMEEQLFELWDKGMGIFTHSLSGLEIITGEVNKLINNALEGDIASGLKNAQDDILNLMQDMRDVVEDEQLYDAAAMLYRPLTKTIERMLDLYQGKEDDIFSKTMLSWSSQVGLVPDRSGEEDICAFSETRFSVRSAVNALLIPPNWRGYERILTNYRKRKINGTFDRTLAIKREDILFFAPGDSIFDTITTNALTSCRGRCSALATYADIDFEGILLVWNIEPQILPLLEAGVSIQLLSQFRAYLPMEQIYTVFPTKDKYSDIKASIVKDVLLSMAGYSKKIKHLGERRSLENNAPIRVFMSAYTPERWKRTIEKAYRACRVQAFQEVRDLADIKSANTEANRIVNAFRASLLYFNRIEDGIEELSTAYQAIIQALRRPQITLDSAAYVKLVKHD